MKRTGKARFGGLISPLAALIFLVPPIAAQTARQGEPESTEFHSPMILDAVFVANTPDLWNDRPVSGKEWDFRKYHCDNVSIGSLVARGKLRKDGMVAFEIEITMTNRKGHDKEVAVRFDILDGDRVASSAHLNYFQVDEGKSKTRSVKLVIPRDVLRTDPTTPFRITVTARDI